MTAIELKKKRISAVSLGCDKNRVELERILFSLKEHGFNIVNEGEECDIVIINTCAFILPARKESVNEILEAVHKKNKGLIEKIIVTGCLTEKGELSDSLPEVDAFVLARENVKIVNAIENVYGLSESKITVPKSRLLTGRLHYAFLKIADGCNNACTYCTIPRIKGRYRSVPIEELLKEAKSLVRQGVRELIIIAQDTTRYGEELYGENRFIELIERLSAISGLVWIRLLYCYPEKVGFKLLNLIKNNPKVCKYIDIPLQHIDGGILKDMNRKLNEEETRALITNINEKYPEITLRSTFILGFPGENNRIFHKLCQFLITSKMDYVGFFGYSREDGTRAYFMRKQVSRFVKKRRIKKAFTIQEDVMKTKCRAKIGTETIAVIDYFDEISHFYVGHTEFLTPEIDPILKIVDSGNIIIGKFYKIKITSFENLEFQGEII